MTACDCCWYLNGEPLETYEWRFTVNRNGLNQAEVFVDDCTDLSGAETFCDFLEYRCDGRIWQRFLLSQYRGGALYGVGTMALMQRRRFDSQFELSGPAATVWNELFDRADAIAEIPVEANLAQTTPNITVDVTAKSQAADTLELLAPYVTWVEHGGALISQAADDTEFSALSPVLDFTCGRTDFDGRARVNQVAVLWGEMLEGCWLYPPVVEGDCVLQSVALKFTEIRDPEAAGAMAEKIYNDLSVDQLVADVVTFDVSEFDSDAVIPGFRFATDDGEFGLAQLTVEGFGKCAQSIVGSFDQADLEALATRTRATE